MSEQLDYIAPADIGEDKFSLSVNSLSKPLLALNPVVIDIDYTGTGEFGYTLPIEVIVQPPSIDGIGYVRRVFRKHAPTSFTFVPITAGIHLVLVKECCHNLWQGRLVINVGGDEADKTEPLDRV